MYELSKSLFFYCLRTNRKIKVRRELRREHVIVTPTLADEIVSIVAKINLSDDHTLFFDEDDIQIDFTTRRSKSGMKRHKDCERLNANKRARPNFVAETSLRRAVVNINSYY